MPGADQRGDFLAIRVGVFLTQDVERRFDDLVFVGLPFHSTDVDQLLRQVHGQRILQHRDDHVVAKDDDVLDVVGAHDPIERLDDFLDVMEMEVIGTALIPGLRPAAHRGAARLDALDLLAPLDRPETKHEDAGMAGIEHDRGVCADIGQSFAPTDRGAVPGR